jgi:hypothetical protein
MTKKSALELWDRQIAQPGVCIAQWEHNSRHRRLTASAGHDHTGEIEDANPEQIATILVLAYVKSKAADLC